MKKITLVLAIVCAVTASKAQLSNVLSKSKAVATAAGFDVNGLTSSIMSKLTPSLSLTKDQQPKVTSAVNTYLTGKSKIMSLLKTDKAAYAKKQSSLFGTLKSSLTTVLVQNQMNKFLGLKSASTSSANVLSQLFS